MRKKLVFSTALAGALLTAAPVLADDYYTGASQSYSDRYDSSRYNTQQYGTNGVRLNDVDDAQQRLSNAPVTDASGETVGRVADMDTDTSGRVEAIQVSLNDGDTAVSIPAEEARFDRDGDTVRTDLTWWQIREMSNSQTPSYYDEY